MSKLTGMWIAKFDDEDESAQDGQVISEIGNDYILVTLRNVIGGASFSTAVQDRGPR
jgi:hypothetical protein